MLKIILLGLTLAIAVFALVASMQPDDFRYTRSATMKASAATIFPHINNQHKWQAWSPWARLDPNAKISFEGPDEGIGSVMSWDGNSELGAGKSTIIGSRMDEFVQFRLDFLKPMAATNTAEFTITEQNGHSTVTWVMYGKVNFFGKAFGLIIDCEKMVGDMFDKGLANLKEITEAQQLAIPALPAPVVEEAPVPAEETAAE